MPFLPMLLHDLNPTLVATPTPDIGSGVFLEARRGMTMRQLCSQLACVIFEDSRILREMDGGATDRNRGRWREWSLRGAKTITGLVRMVMSSHEQWIMFSTK